MPLHLRYQGELRAADPMARHRLVPVSRLISRLGLEPFNHKAPFEPLAYRPAEVRLSLRQHIGIAATPCVKTGDPVRAGQLIATVAKDKLGASLHASVDGVVTALNETTITIKTMETTCTTPSP